MDSTYPIMLKDFYLELTPLMRWACFAVDIFTVLCLLAVMRIHQQTINPLLRFFLCGVIIHTGQRGFAIMQGAELFISPWTLIGAISIAGACALSALGKTGLRGDTPPAIEVDVKLAAHDLRLNRCVDTVEDAL